MTPTQYTSRIASLRERDAADYPYVVHGVAQAAGELTHGQNGPKYWPAAELQQAAPTLAGQTVYSVHDGDRHAVGEILAAAYDETRDAVVYEAGLEDAEIAEALSIGEREPTIEAANPDAVDRHDETGAVIMRGFEYTGMATTEQGASDASYAAPGSAAENPAVAALSAASIQATLHDDDDADGAGAALAVGDDGWSAGLRLFRVVPAEGDETDYDNDVLGVGVAFPDAGVYVDWQRAAFPDELDDPHVSEYGSIPDLRKATGNDIVDMTQPPGERASLADLGQFAPGGVVSWRTGNGTLAYGKVQAKIQRGQFDDLLSTDQVVTAPAVLIGVHEPGQGDTWTPAERLVARKPGSVTRHDDFPAAPASEAAMAALAADSYEVTNVSPDEITGDGPGFTDTEWDGDDVTASLPNPSEADDAAGVLDQTMALVPTDDEARDAKSNWKAPFRDGPDAPVNTRALVAIDAAISGARGGFEGVADATLDALSDWTQSMLAAAPDGLFGADDPEAAAATAGWLAATTADDPSGEAQDRDTADSTDSPTTATATDSGGTDTMSNDNDTDSPDVEALLERVDEKEAQIDDLEAELEAKAETIDEKEERIAELEETNEELREQNEAAREQYAAALAEADTILSEDELAEQFTLAELSEKVEEVDFAADDGTPEPTVRSGGGPSAEANLSAAEQERKAELEERKVELEDADNDLAEKELERVEAELAEIMGGEA
ncbi:hypothetical protein SAMN05216388_101776 [Halorientalis persicus]|uniref:Uncharacterized protein n=1 Tax=Halorientalis persicus TaxID=1367881 RepID=A0A1H8RYL7_9EURY|nr:hypothetical protein [Halorientalis persicus]SEO71228.1 hypothetical protein SAMN05216388_101776 [Halorientalis persicus]